MNNTRLTELSIDEDPHQVLQREIEALRRENEAMIFQIQRKEYETKTNQILIDDYQD